MGRKNVYISVRRKERMVGERELELRWSSIKTYLFNILHINNVKSTLTVTHSLIDTRVNTIQEIVATKIIEFYEKACISCVLPSQQLLVSKYNALAHRKPRSSSLTSILLETSLCFLYILLQSLRLSSGSFTFTRRRCNSKTHSSKSHLSYPV